MLKFRVKGTVYPDVLERCAAEYRAAIVSGVSPETAWIAERQKVREARQDAFKFRELWKEARRALAKAADLVEGIRNENEKEAEIARSPDTDPTPA